MNFPCLVTIAENSYEARAERREKALQAARESLSAEFMAAACMPGFSTINCPAPGFSHRRDSFLEVFYDDLTARKHRDLAARAVSILMRSAEGREVVQTLADAHGEFYADDAVGDGE